MNASEFEGEPAILCYHSSRSALITRAAPASGVMNCPGCSREVIEGKSTCPFCGLIFEKWKGAPGRTTKEHVIPPSLSVPVAEPEPEGVTERIRTPAFILGTVAALFVVLIVALGIRHFISGVGTAVQQKTRASSTATPESKVVKRASLDVKSDFDLVIDSGGDPLGLAWGDGEFIAGNRTSPWGFLRVKPAGPNEFNEPQNISVVDSGSDQKIGLRTVAWNGKQYLGYTDGAYFDKTHKNVFTVHDPKTLAVTDTYPAPELIGGLAWDGSGYWAATRRNTADTNEPAFLYRLDQRFNVLGRYDPPAVGCQGLAWDGAFLWWVDVFTDNIYVLKVDGAKPEKVHTYHTNINYLSGIAFDGSNLWIVEYGEKRLRRLNPRLRQQWAAGDYRIRDSEQAIAALESFGAGDSSTDRSKEELLRSVRDDPGNSRDAIDQLEKMGARDQAIDALQESVRSPDNRIHSQAKDALRRMGVLPSYDRYANNFSRTGDDADAIETSAEIIGDKIRVSWRIYYGSTIFSNTGNPPIARYKVTLAGGSLAAPVVKEYEARPGDNVKSEDLAASLGPGRYTVEFTISAQYLDGNGTNKALNRTVPPLEVGK